MAKCMPTDYVPAIVRYSTEWKQRMRDGRITTHKPVFEGPRQAVAVVNVSRAWAGKPQTCNLYPGQATTSKSYWRSNRHSFSAMSSANTFGGFTAIMAR